MLVIWDAITLIMTPRNLLGLADVTGASIEDLVLYNLVYDMTM